jgi:hypothetical protein
MGERFTLVFDGDLRRFGASPFKTDTPFGRAQIASIGDVCAERDALMDALQDIANLPEQGGCGDGIDAVDLWMLMQKKARAAIDAAEGMVSPHVTHDEDGARGGNDAA